MSQDNDVTLLKQELAVHIADFNEHVEEQTTREEEQQLYAAEFREHIEEFRSHVVEEHDRWDTFIKVQEENTIGLTVLAESVKAHAKATEGLVETWRTVSALQRFIKWVSSFAIIGVAIAWVADEFGQ